MQHREVEPPEELRETINRFWFTSKDFGEQPSSFEVIPDGYAEIIFYFGCPCSIATKTGLLALPSPFLVGLLNQPAHFHG